MTIMAEKQATGVWESLYHKNLVITFYSGGKKLFAAQFDSQVS